MSVRDSLKARGAVEVNQAAHWLGLCAHYLDSFLYCLGRGEIRGASIHSGCLLAHLDTAQRHIAYADSIAGELMRQSIRDWTPPHWPRPPVIVGPNMVPDSEGGGR